MAMGVVGDSVPLSNHPGVRLLARQEDCIGEHGVVASHLKVVSRKSQWLGLSILYL